MGWRWFKKKPEKCNREDVRFFNLLCCGRDPENDTEISLRLGSSPFALCSTLLSSESFRRDLLEPLLLDRLPALTRFSVDQQALIKAGLKRYFGISPSQDKLGDWLSCVSVAVQSDRFLRAIEASRLTISAASFRDKVSGATPNPSDDLVGGIDSLSAGHVSGFAISRQSPGKRLMIEIFVNGEYVGTARTQAQHRNIQESHGGDGLSGFHLDLNLPPHLARQDQLVVHAFDAESKVAICNGQTLHNFSVRHEHYLSRLLGELAALRRMPDISSDDVLQALSRIEAELPKITQFAALPIGDYCLHAQLFEPENAQTPASPVPDIHVLDPGQTTEGDPADLLIFNGPDENLAAHALEHLVAASKANPNAVIFFADHDTHGLDGLASNPTFKAAFDYDLLLANPGYACAYAIRRDTFNKLGGFAPEAGNGRHHDLWLRAFEAHGPSGFSHVGAMLWHMGPDWKAPAPQDVAAGLQRHFERVGVAASASPLRDAWGGDTPDLMQITWPHAEPLPKLAVIIPTRDALELTKNCVESLQSTLAFPDQTEIVVIDNGSSDEAMLQWLDTASSAGLLKVVRSDTPFNWSALNNLGARATDADYLLFLNNDTEATEQGWDAVLRGQLARKDVGTVGARLLFEDGTIQFAGYVLEPRQIAVKKHYSESPRGGGYQHLSQLSHEVSALIGAFLACTRTTFEQLDGFDEDLGVAFNDIDFTIRATDQGLRNLYCPAITFYHYESKTRGYDAMDPEKKSRERSERSLLSEKHAKRLAQDPRYPSAFIACEPTYTLLAPPKH